MASVRYQLYLDTEIDSDIMDAIAQVANGGSESKALTRIIHEWYCLRVLPEKAQPLQKAEGVTASQNPAVTPQCELHTSCTRGVHNSLSDFDDDLATEFDKIFEQ